MNMHGMDFIFSIWFYGDMGLLGQFLIKNNPCPYWGPTSKNGLPSYNNAK